MYYKTYSYLSFCTMDNQFWPAHFRATEMVPRDRAPPGGGPQGRGCGIPGGRGGGAKASLDPRRLGKEGTAKGDPIMEYVY